MAPKIETESSEKLSQNKQHKTPQLQTRVGGTEESVLDESESEHGEVK